MDNSEGKTSSLFSYSYFSYEILPS